MKFALLLIAAAASAGNQTVDSLLGYERVDSPVKLYDAPVSGWDLPMPARTSWLDRVGWNNIIVKGITPARELVASRKEIEYIASSSSARVAYAGKATRVPAHWTEFPAVIQPIIVEPPLTALSVSEKSAARRSISKFSATRFYTFYPKIKGDGVPLTYSLPATMGNSVALVFLAGSASKEVDLAKLRVTSRRVKNTSRTSVDFDADGQPEIIILRSFPGDPGCNPQIDQCGSPASVIVALHHGVWYKTAEIKRGQDGWLGF